MSGEELMLRGIISQMPEADQKTVYEHAKRLREAAQGDILHRIGLYLASLQLVEETPNS